MNESDHIRHLFGRIRNDLRAIGRLRADRTQTRLVADATENLGHLETEVLRLTKREVQQQRSA